MTDPWRDPENYKKGKPTVCHGCGAKCLKNHWGSWCYGCNVKRIDRINGRFAAFEASLSNGERKDG